ncbi:hypothetical protein CK203_032390 [Vitis vinifera]|uniref:Reverse transcriptase/retrotransposon-derived protein RNase H-like domain-containing protein n=1 Tax=Vitis vinifera TaxID=29760 RepID=A0A438IK11_VITVI|nr:hypothetical protein CK203_032390 [Vitis vinifera]
MLKRNKDIFTWTHSNIPGIHLSVASHKLNISPTSQLVRQKVQRFHPDSETRAEHIQHLEKAFHLMRAYNMKLNPTKCVFGVSARKFFRVYGHFTALGCFIARFTGKLRHFFLTLRGVSTFCWIDKCEQALGAVKRYLTKPPILSSPKSGEELYMYLVVSDYAFSTIMFHQIQDKEKMLVYYVSKAMVDIETRYSQVEQTALALKDVARKLRPYFQAH